MKLLIFICMLAGLLVQSSTSTRCVCKCCTTDGCDSSTATPESFDLSGVCSAVTCNRLTCSTQFKDCPIPTSAGHVDSKCSEPNMATAATQTPIMVLSAFLIGTFIARSLY